MTKHILTIKLDIDANENIANIFAQWFSENFYEYEITSQSLSFKDKSVILMFDIDFEVDSLDFTGKCDFTILQVIYDDKIIYEEENTSCTKAELSFDCDHKYSFSDIAKDIADNLKSSKQVVMVTQKIDMHGCEIDGNILTQSIDKFFEVLEKYFRDARDCYIGHEDNKFTIIGETCCGQYFQYLIYNWKISQMNKFVEKHNSRFTRIDY